MRRLTISIFVLLASACGDIETTENGEGNANDEVVGSGLHAGRKAATSFGVERYGISSSWYDYDGTTHVLTPRPKVYLIRNDTQLTAFEIDSYYNDRGDSGYFSLTGRTLVDGTWSELASFTTTNVKEAPVCLSAFPFGESSCESADLVLRTSLRAVPAAGFAVFNPAIFTRSTVEVGQVDAETVTDIETWDDSVSPLVSASADPSVSRVGWVIHPDTQDPASHLHLQYTPNLNLVAWQVLSANVVDKIAEIELAVFCSEGEGQDLQFGEQRTLNLAAKKGVSLATLCGDGGSLTPSESAPAGLWPNSDTFDLLVDNLDTGVALRVAPGHLHKNWSLANEADFIDISNVDIDAEVAELWDE